MGYITLIIDGAAIRINKSEWEDFKEWKASVTPKSKKPISSILKDHNLTIEEFQNKRGRSAKEVTKRIMSATKEMMEIYGEIGIPKLSKELGIPQKTLYKRRSSLL